MDPWTTEDIETLIAFVEETFNMVRLVAFFTIVNIAFTIYADFFRGRARFFGDRRGEYL